MDEIENGTEDIWWILEGHDYVYSTTMSLGNQGVFKFLKEVA